MATKLVISRREFVKDAGGLLIGFSLADSAVLPRAFAAASPETVTAPNPDRLDSWLRIDKEGIVHVFTGKPEIGMGVSTAFAQIVAEELDVPLDRVQLVMADTGATPNQGGVGRQHVDHAGFEAAAQRRRQRALSAHAARLETLGRTRG